jgi:tetratricopeptide (TPR) repeat protein
VSELATVLSQSAAVSAAASQAPVADANADLARADVLVVQGKLDQALSVLNQLWQKDPKTPGLEARLGKLYYQKRDYLQAAPHLEAALKDKPNDGESTQLLGLSYYLLGHVQQAIPLLEKVDSRMSQPDVTASYLLGISYLQSYRYDKARASFAKMFSVPAESAQAHVVLGQMMIREEFEDKAVPELQKAVAMDPRLPMAHFLLGEIYLFKSKVDLALEEFHKELEINPILWLAYWRMGDAYTRLEKWDEAERALKQAIWLNENFTGPYILLGKVELKKGDANLAAGFLQKALKMDPNNYSAHYLLGTAYKELGRTADAGREFGLTRTLRSDEKP